MDKFDEYKTKKRKHTGLSAALTPPLLCLRSNILDKLL